MKIKNRTLFASAFIGISSFLVMGAFATRNSSFRPTFTYADDAVYSYNVLSELNVADGSGHSVTQNGNDVEFAWTNFDASEDEDVWGVANGSATIYNVDPINGIARVGVLSDGAVTLEYGWTYGTYIRQINIAASTDETARVFDVTATAESPTYIRITVPSGKLLKVLNVRYSCVGGATRNDVYEISTPDELNGFAKLINNGNKNLNGKLMNDIDMDGVTFSYPIGFSDTLPFSGTFDGQNHTLSNISITGNDSIALFSRATNATIKNLKIENIQVTITGSQRAAALVARADNVTLENIEIVSGSIGTSTSKIAKQAGGIVAFALNGLTMTNCINRADVYSAGAANGGMLGAVHTTAITVTLSNCVNYGNITGGSDGTGGIVGGVNTKSATYNISSCINYGAITGAGNGTGGILGATGGGNVSVTKISNCDNYGDVTGTAYVGGIGGILREGDKTNSLITNCYNAGNIAGTGVGVGGITGISRIDTTDCMCLHTATVKGSVASGLNAIGTTVSGNGGAGSVAGYISGSAGNGATVTGKLVDSNKDEYIPS